MKTIFLLITLSLNLFTQTLEEKIAQLIFPAYDTKDEKKISDAINNNIGGIQIQWGTYSLDDTRNTIKKIYKNYKYYPPFIAIDYEGGSVYIHQTHNLLDIPSNMAIGNANDAQNTVTMFYLLGLELKKIGINTVFAPSLDVNTEEKNPIINVRAFSNDYRKVEKFGEYVSKGFNAAGIITTLKHFPGHGMTEQDSHISFVISDIEPIKLYDTHIYPFKSLIEKNLGDMIMLSHIIYKNIDNDFPASMSPIIIKILREQLNFNGLIITDSLDMGAITNKYSIEKAAVISIKNGCDMVLIGKYNYRKVLKEILKAVNNKTLSKEQIDNAYNRIIKFKENKKLKEFEIYSDEFDIAYKKMANEIAIKSINIPKNNNIPLDKNLKINLIFIVPQRYSHHAVNLYELMTKNGYDIKLTIINNDKKINTEDISKDANKYNTIIIAGYFWPYISKRKKDTIIEMTKKYKNKIYINLLNPYDTKILSDNFDSIIESYGINEYSINAISSKLIK